MAGPEAEPHDTRLACRMAYGAVVGGFEAASMLKMPTSWVVFMEFLIKVGDSSAKDIPS